MTLGEAHEVLLAVRDTFPRLSREREALAVVSNALDAHDALVAALRAWDADDEAGYSDLIGIICGAVDGETR